MTADDMVPVPRELAERLLDNSTAANGARRELDAILNPPKPPSEVGEPQLGLATTLEMLDELKCRGEVEYGISANPAAAGLATKASELKASLPLDLLSYRTVGDPPKPPSVVTDEMVEAILPQMPLDYTSHWGHLRAVTRAALELAECKGLLRDPNAPPGLLTGTVKEAGGGSVTILVDRDTPWYPYPGGRVRLFDEASEYTPPTEADERLMALNRTLTERLEMAEGLLRKATRGAWLNPEGASWWISDAAKADVHEVTPAEADYLRSLTVEGETDE